MLTSRYALAKAFLTVFVPRYSTVKDVAAWRIFHDFTGWDGPRGKRFDFIEWVEMQIWQSDGVQAQHPTLALTLLFRKLALMLSTQKALILTPLVKIQNSCAW